uniref:Translation initiation factor 5A C-terminal domain-containing protein n=1 Tax=Lotharella oceanica TaxID=641309 RepID=A0A7S2XFL6_9EUKA
MAPARSATHWLFIMAGTAFMVLCSRDHGRSLGDGANLKLFGANPGVRRVIRVRCRHPRRTLIGGSGDGEEGDITRTEASHLKKGQMAMIKDQPCRIVDNAVSKVGKHGAAKCHLVGKNIFTGNKVEEICPGHSSVDVPSIKKSRMTVLEYNADEGTLNVMDEENNLARDDLTVPDNNPKLQEQIENLLEEGKEFKVVVLKCQGQEQVIDVVDIQDGINDDDLREEDL